MSKPPKKVHRVEVEQAIAFGRSPDWMRDHLGASDLKIDAAMRWIDQCHSEDEQGLPPVPCGTPQGFNRHRLRREKVDPRCRYANSAHEAAKQAAKAARRDAPTPAADLTRPIDSYYGPASADTITALIAALDGAA